MNPVKKILVLHGDAKVRRRLVLLIADLGLDVRARPDLDAAADCLRTKWFDLALLDPDPVGASIQDAVKRLRQAQPTLPLLLVTAQLELGLVVQGIRLGVTDVVALDPDPSILSLRICTMLGIQGPAQAALDDLAQEKAATSAVVLPTTGQHDLTDLSRENAALTSRVERLMQEKAGLKAELAALLSQGVDTQRMEAELAGLRTERELAAATQAAIDEKARGLAELRASVAAERSALEKERASKASAAKSREQVQLEDWRKHLEAREDRLAGESGRIRQEAAQLAQERRRWHDDLDLLRDQEVNLRDYEHRLRNIQAQLEADRVLWFSGQARSPQPTPFMNDAALKEAWAKLQRASELLEAEKSNFKDERLRVDEREVAVKRREAQVRDREIKASLNEAKLKSLPPVQSKPKPSGFSLPRLALGRRG